jgi:exonuclease SbcC
MDSNTGTQSQVLVNETLEETIAEGKTAVQIKMEEILGIDATTFSSAIYASQGEIGKIVTSTAKERKKLFDRLFQIDRFEHAWANLAKVKKIVESTQEKLEIQISNLKFDLEKLPELKEQITEKEKQLQEEKELLAAKEKQYEVIDKQHDKLNDLVSEYQIVEGEYNSAKDNVEQLNKTITDQIKNLAKALRKKDELVPSVDKVKNLLEELKNDLQKVEGSLDELQEEETKTNVIMENISNTEQRYKDLGKNIIKNEKQLSIEVSDFCEKITGLPNNLDLWSKELPTILAATEKDKKEKEKEKKKLSKISQKISDVTGQLKIHEESSSSLHTKIVKKRLNLAKEAGDDWQKKIDNFAKTDFSTKTSEIKGTIATKEEAYTDLIGKKEGIEAALTRIENDLNHLANLEGEETCPTCKQSLSEETLVELSKTLKKEKSESIRMQKSYKKELKEIKNNLAALKEDLEELENQNKLYEKIK